MAVTNTNVLFKRGNQAQLPTAGNAIDGAFYLTQDTRRLFVGDSNKNLIPLCETVQIVDSLPRTTDAIEGQFYYISGSNVLCIYENAAWKQINTNTDTWIGTFGQTVTKATDSELVTILTKIVGNADGGAGAQVGAEKTSTIQLEGKNGVSLEVNDKKVTINGTTYTLNGTVSNDGSEATISLDNSGSKVKFKGEGVSFEQVSSGDEDVIKIVADENTDTTYTLGGQQGGTSGTGYTVSLTENDTNKPAGSATIDPEFFVKDASKAKVSGVKIVNGEALLDTYSTAVIDSKMNALNAMRYLGTVGQDGSAKTLPTSGVQAGDTYMVNNGTGTFTVATGVYAQTGDLVIATGTETNGVLTSITWEVIPAGNEDTLYKLEKTTNGFQLQETTGAGAVKGSVSFDEDEYIDVTVGGSGQTATVKVAHKDVASTQTTGAAKTQTPGTELTVPVVTSVTIDDKGHATEVVTQNVTFTDSDTKVSSAAFTASASNNVATIKDTITLVNAVNGPAGTVEASYTVSSKNENLTVAASGSNVDLNFVWGTF